MATSQQFPVVPPMMHDREELADYSEIIQRNFQTLYDESHRHKIFNSEPKITELEIGVPVVANINNSYYLYIRVDKTTLARTNLTIV